MVVHQHEDASFTARVWVDGSLLRPDCVGRGRAEMLAYAEQALIDARADDHIDVRLQGSAEHASFRASDSALALCWLADRVQTEGATSGTRPVARAEDADAPATPGCTA